MPGIAWRKLGVDREGVVDVMNVKCDPLLTAQLRHQPGFRPAYHMNKVHWISVLLPDAAENLVDFLVNASYEATRGKMKRKKAKQTTSKRLQTVIDGDRLRLPDGYLSFIG